MSQIVLFAAAARPGLTLTLTLTLTSGHPGTASRGST